MKKNIVFFAVSALVAAAFVLPQIASAGLVYDATINPSAQGFGNAPRDLTLHATGQTDFESGSISVSTTGEIVFGSAIPDSWVFLGNGIANSSLLDAMPNPQADNQKYGIPTTGSLGITSASQIAVLFNATEPGGNSINVTDLTLKFYTSAGAFLGAIDGQQNFQDTGAGNGIADFTFVIDQDQQDFVNGLLAIGGAGTMLALEASITGFDGGPETFLIYNRGGDGGGTGTSVPEPGTVALVGLGLLGFVASRRKSAKSKNA